MNLGYLVALLWLAICVAVGVAVVRARASDGETPQHAVPETLVVVAIAATSLTALWLVFWGIDFHLFGERADRQDYREAARGVAACAMLAGGVGLVVLILLRPRLTSWVTWVVTVAGLAGITGHLWQRVGRVPETAYDVRAYDQLIPVLLSPAAWPLEAIAISVVLWRAGQVTTRLRAWNDSSEAASRPSCSPPQR